MLIEGRKRGSGLTAMPRLDLLPGGSPREHACPEVRPWAWQPQKTEWLYQWGPGRGIVGLTLLKLRDSKIKAECQNLSPGKREGAGGVADGGVPQALDCPRMGRPGGRIMSENKRQLFLILVCPVLSSTRTCS